MTKETDILNHVHQTADMGRQTLNHLIALTENEELKSTLERQVKAYNQTCTLSEEMLKERHSETIDNAKTTSVLMANIMSELKLMTNPTASKLADMAIQGSSMGITKLTKLLNSYAGADKTVLTFAQNEIETEEQNIEALKTFL